MRVKFSYILHLSLIIRYLFYCFLFFIVVISHIAQKYISVAQDIFKALIYQYDIKIICYIIISIFESYFIEWTASVYIAIFINFISHAKFFQIIFKISIFFAIKWFI